MSGSRLGLRAMALGIAAVLLVACGRPAPRPVVPEDALLSAQQRREARLDAAAHWSLEGRVAVRNGEDGGSGQLVWRRRDDAQELTLRAPVSGQGWRLETDPGGALIEGLEGGPLRGPDADRLLRDAVGWDVPLALLARWVRGQRGSPSAEVEFDAEGRPAVLRDGGWRIEYRGWDTSVDPVLPRRIEAESGDRRVRLLVRSWQLDDAP
ncbi:lipoprotein insertase outer membrane protein LolB [Pseudomarimonas salicorniae]|uniref:Outer-membrane lipoprotein LolB n=1 Tax=Pseudomarimonas salicorniae TaxID=2933270 RepID=A0ABT0GIB6_9GAMM|nr:lipoprotein insertase outer membrane protein LolB [Lysobacter sp. CAU 1642]MCK7594290.1 lipoprotein insertase outer membrane protein LolB [Lysobacter sp. CAU 1642]